MKTKIRIIFKLLLIIVCIFCFLLLLQRDTKIFRIKQPQGEGITVKDVMILMQAFEENAVSNNDISEKVREWRQQLQERYTNMEQEKFLYGDYIEMARLLSEDKKFELQGKYRNDFYLLKEDWYESYDRFLELYGLTEKIKLTEVSALAGGDQLSGAAADSAFKEKQLVSAEGKLYRYESEEVKECYFSRISTYICEDTLLTVKERTKEEFTLSNVWIMETDEEKIQFFINDFEIIYRYKQDEMPKNIVRENITDITFAEGELREAKRKEEKISGVLLRLSDTELELKDKGTYGISEKCKIYQLYEELREADFAALRIGYDFADYVIEDGKICAVLIMRKENMESIRVAVMNSDFQSLYHERIELSADCDMELIYGPYENRERKIISKEEKISFDSISKYLAGDRVELIPSVQSGKIKVISVERSQGSPQYRGRMEIVKTKEGLILINELLLEEYLYSVVPSEMPASYPSESLKAQAVCARTYAYKYLLSPGLSDIGAHVDDSVNYQVYNNIAENVNATRAVKETTGILLYYGDEPVSTYYYSTSCGFGTNAGIWGEDNAEKFPYLLSRHIAENCADSESTEKETSAEMTREDVFRRYILSAYEEDYEKDEPWYRWQYEVNKLDVEKLAERLQKSFKEIYDISITKRREGGVADVLTIETDKGTFEVSGEYNIRYILNNGGSIVRQDGSASETGIILPSAYMIIDIVKDKGIVVGYNMFGGGYGHGVGMSQNGAKAMGSKGKKCEEILTFFYPGCHMKKMY